MTQIDSLLSTRYSSPSPLDSEPGAHLMGQRGGGRWLHPAGAPVATASISRPDASGLAGSSVVGWLVHRTVPFWAADSGEGSPGPALRDGCAGERGPRRAVTGRVAQCVDSEGAGNDERVA